MSLADFMICLGLVVLVFIFLLSDSVTRQALVRAHRERRR
jgi:hypothetical protein